MSLDIQMGDADGNARTVRLSGRLDAAQADRALAALSPLSGALTLDLTGLEYISSAGLGVVVQTYKRLVAAGGSLRLVNLEPRVRNVFSLSGLDRVIPVE